MPDPIKAELSLNWAEIAQLVQDGPLWELARGRYSRTFDQEKLAEGVRRYLGTKVKKDSLVLVTDQEITPPKD